MISLLGGLLLRHLLVTTSAVAGANPSSVRITDCPTVLIPLAPSQRPILRSFRRISYLCHPSCQQSIAIGDASAPSPSIPSPARTSSSSLPSPHQIGQQHRLTTTPN
ncbi:hypothetical protein EDB85DRAFT_1986518 [Lactarius pseudohatsudake]|nr:hypothetical protein EDB85DRAFT_1986518 [Lactarius pseudohatsudake]